MHTDAYDPDELALWVTAEDATEEDAAASADAVQTTTDAPHDDVATAPIDISAWAHRTEDAAQTVRYADADDTDAQAAAERSSDAALRRWLSD